MSDAHKKSISDSLKAAWSTLRCKRQLGERKTVNGNEYEWIQTAKGWRHWVLVRHPVVIPSDIRQLTSAQRSRLRKAGYDVPKLEGRKSWKLSIEARMRKSVRMRKYLFDVLSIARDQKDRARKSLVYRMWRDSVFLRDAYTCQECGAKNGNGIEVVLEAHHIKSYAKYPTLRFVVSNGRTLCRPCHLKQSAKQMKGNKNGRRKASNGTTPIHPFA